MSGPSIDIVATALDVREIPSRVRWLPSVDPRHASVRLSFASGEPTLSASGGVLPCQWLVRPGQLRLVRPRSGSLTAAEIVLADPVAHTPRSVVILSSAASFPEGILKKTRARERRRGARRRQMRLEGGNRIGLHSHNSPALYCPRYRMAFAAVESHLCSLGYAFTFFLIRQASTRFLLAIDNFSNRQHDRKRACIARGPGQQCGAERRSGKQFRTRLFLTLCEAWICGCADSG